VKVLLLISHLTRAGAETQLVELARALDRTLHSVEVVLIKERNDFSAALSDAGVPVTALRQRGRLGLAGAWLRLVRHLRTRPPDVLHTYLYFGNLVGVLAGRTAGIPAVIASQRSSYLQPSTRPIWPAPGRYAQRLADRLIVNSQALRCEELAAGFPESRLVCIPNGVRAVAGDSATAELDGAPRVLCVGRLDAEKGHTLLLDAWPAVRAAHPNAVLSLLGDGPLAAALAAQVQRLGIADSVRFLGFHAPATPFLLGCDVCVQASPSEGMPNALLEAMAAGRPVVASAAGGTVELVVDGVTGRLAPPGDSGALAAALIEILGQPGLWRPWGEAGRRRVGERFSMEVCAEATAAVYRDVLRSKARA
jgi:glycosyltransferase involved in cell wall biosynthesis